MENIKILPCPFCGGKGELLYVACVSYVHCKKCGSEGEKFEIDRKYSSDEKAVEAWNLRFNNKSLSNKRSGEQSSKDENIEMLTIIRSSIDVDESSKNEGKTVLNGVSPDSLEFVIDEAIIALNKGDD